MIRLIIAATIEQLSGIMEALATVEHSGMSVETGDTPTNGVSASDAAHDASIDAKVRAANRARRATATADRAVTRGAAVATKRQATTRIGRVVLYTPAGTKAQIRKTLETLAPKSASAYVYADLMKHPKSKNAEVRARIAKQMDKAGLSVESVDNTIWQLVNKGLITKSAAQ